MNIKMTQEEINAGRTAMKEELIKHLDEVNVETDIDKALTEIGQMALMCELFDVKIMQDFFGKVEMTFIVQGLRAHGHNTFELHFPCGTKFCVVMHHRENYGIRSFAYKL